MKAVRLFSENYEGTLMTKAAYEEVTLQMSTADFHTHTHELVKVEDDELDTVLGIRDVLDNAQYDIEELRLVVGGAQ